MDPLIMKCKTKNNNDIEIDFKSKYILFPSENPLKRHCNAIIDKLMLQYMDTYNGISVVCEQPMGNKIMLNIKRPAVLRQYYGADISNHGDTTVK